MAAGSGTYLFVLPWELDAPGGVNNVVQNLLLRFAAEGPWRPLLMVSSWEHARPAVEVGPLFSTVRFRLRSPQSSVRTAKNLSAFVATAPWSLARLARLLTEHDVRVVNLHYVSLNALPFVLLRRLGWYRGTVLLSFHGSDLREAKRAPRWARPLWAWLVRSADAIVGCSRAFRREILRSLPQSVGKVEVVSNGIDPRVFLGPHQTDYPLPEAFRGKRRLVNAATFEHKKGQDVLLRAFARIAASFPETVLVLVGRASADLPRIEDLVAAHPFSDRIHLFPNVPSEAIPALLSAAEVFVLPSCAEPFGIVLLEAGLCGVPVVASRVGGIPEIVDSGETGLLVEPGDDAALAEALRFLLERPEERARLSAALRRRVLADFSWDRARRAYAALAEQTGAAVTRRGRTASAAPPPSGSQ